MATHLRRGLPTAYRLSISPRPLISSPGGISRLLACYPSSLAQSYLRDSRVQRIGPVSPVSLGFTYSRHYSSSTPRPLTEPGSGESTQTTEQSDAARVDVPSYNLTFTCKPCKTRSTHRISKQGYHHGTVLITCPSCSNRHLIADHLNIFSDRSMTIDKFLEEHGEVVQRGTLGPNGDIELWNNKGGSKSNNKKADQETQPRDQPTDNASG